MTECDAGLGIRPDILGIRPAVLKRSRHRRHNTQQHGVVTAAGPKQACYSAHDLTDCLQFKLCQSLDHSWPTSGDAG